MAIDETVHELFKGLSTTKALADRLTYNGFVDTEQYARAVSFKRELHYSISEQAPTNKLREDFRYLGYIASDQTKSPAHDMFNMLMAMSGGGGAVAGLMLAAPVVGVVGGVGCLFSYIGRVYFDRVERQRLQMSVDVAAVLPDEAWRQALSLGRAEVSYDSRAGR